MYNDSVHARRGDAEPTGSTVVMPVGPRRGSPIATPDDVLRVDEARRTRIFSGFVCLLVAAAIAAMWVIGGDPRARAIHAGGLLVAAAAALWLLAASSGGRYRTWHNVVFGHACVVAIATGFYYWGPLSAVLLIVPFGAFIFSIGESLGGALSITVHLVAVHAAISLAITGGVLADRSLIAASHLGTTAQLLVLALVHAIFLMTFAIARQLRASSLQAIEELDSALRALGQREAQLVEAQVGLREVVAAGGRGRFTDQEVGGLRLGALLGRGAMGDVYEASRPGSDQVRFAVKLLHPHVLADPAAYARFAREAKAAASLDVPNVVKVIEVSGEGAAVPYLVMERLEGEDLATILQARPVLAVDEVVELVRQLASALASAHDAGIVHRDLKPQNVFAADEGGARVWKLLDFGVSKLAGGDGTLTHGHLIGTPAYMSPEQARGEQVDARSDVYALAVIAYRVLTGRPVIAVADVPAMLHEVCYGMPPRPSSLVPLPGAVDDVLAIGLAKHADDRFASARELADALAAAADGAIAPALRERAISLGARWPWRRAARAAAR